MIHTVKVFDIVNKAEIDVFFFFWNSLVFLMIQQMFESGGQSTGASASESVLSMSIQCCFPLGWTGLIAMHCHIVKDLSRVFSSTTVQNHQFFCTLPNLLVDFQCCFICSHHNILHTTKNILGFYKCNISLCCMGHWLLTASYTMPVFYTEGKNKTFPSSVTPKTVYISLMKQT